MSSISYVTTPARFLNFILTGDDSDLDQRDRETCERWFTPAIMGVIIDVEPGPPLARKGEQYVCVVCRDAELSPFTAC